MSPNQAGPRMVTASSREGLSERAFTGRAMDLPEKAYPSGPLLGERWTCLRCARAARHRRLVAHVDLDAAGLGRLGLREGQVQHQTGRAPIIWPSLLWRLTKRAERG